MNLIPIKVELKMMNDMQLLKVRLMSFRGTKLESQWNYFQIIIKQIQLEIQEYKMQSMVDMKGFAMINYLHM